MVSVLSSVEMAIRGLAEIVSKDACVEYGEHSDDLVAELRVKLLGVVSRWRGNLLTPETSYIPVVPPVTRYECTLGACEHIDNHSEYDLFWIGNIEKKGEEYSAGWYCEYCIENTFDMAIIDSSNKQLVSLADELKRRNLI